MLIESGTREKRCVRISKIGSQIGIQGGLIVFDSQNTFTTHDIDTLHEIFLSVKRIGSTDPSGQRQTG